MPPTLSTPSVRILADPDRGGYLVIIRGSVYWCRTWAMSVQLADILK